MWFAHKFQPGKPTYLHIGGLNCRKLVLVQWLKLLQVILLDTRYHRDPLASDGSILGSSQWKWLEEELNAAPTAITVIGSSIQVLHIYLVLAKFWCWSLFYPLIELFSEARILGVSDQEQEYNCQHIQVHACITCIWLHPDCINWIRLRFKQTQFCVNIC